MTSSTEPHSRTCPTPCDADCTADCHEWHEVAYKREHQPHNCPSAVQNRTTAQTYTLTWPDGNAPPCCNDGPPGHTEQQHHDASRCYDQACPMDHPHGGPYCPGDSLGDHGPRCDCPDADGPSW